MPLHPGSLKNEFIAFNSIEQASLCTAAPVCGDLGSHVYNFATLMLECADYIVNASHVYNFATLMLECAENTVNANVIDRFDFFTIL